MLGPFWADSITVVAREEVVSLSLSLTHTPLSLSLVEEAKERREREAARDADGQCQGLRDAVGRPCHCPSMLCTAACVFHCYLS